MSADLLHEWTPISLLVAIIAAILFAQVRGAKPSAASEAETLREILGELRALSKSVALMVERDSRDHAEIMKELERNRDRNGRP